MILPGMFDRLTFDARLVATVPSGFADIVRTVAADQGLTAADYLRDALQLQLMRDGVMHPPIPALMRTATKPRARS